MSADTLPFERGSSAGYINRADQTRRDNDTVKVPSITIYDVDYAISHHLSENVKLFVTEGGRVIPVKVIYADGEKWSQIRQHGYMRDKDRKALAPVCAIRRTSIGDDDRIPMLNTNLVGPSIKIIPHKTLGMQYDRQVGQYLTKDSYEFYLMDAPNYARISYDLIVWTDLIEQMNGIVEKIIPISDHVWGDFYKFRTHVDSINHETVNVPGEDRLIKTTMTLTVDAFFRNEFEYDQQTMQKAYSLKRVKFMEEGTDEILFDQINNLTLTNTNPKDNISEKSDWGKLRKEIR